VHSACRFANDCFVLVYKLSLLSRPRTQELYRTESLQPPGYPVTAGVQSAVSNRQPVFRAGTCVPEGRFTGTRAVPVGTQDANEP
jgi:hypothetical protein